MKKILIIAGVIVGLCLVGVLVLTFFLGSIVTAGVNRVAPKLTQTNVHLASARISPLSGHGTLTNLVVGNPKGWSDNYLCTLGKIYINVAPFSIFGDHIVINEIDIDAPEFNYETRIIASNVKDLVNNIEATMGGGKDTLPQATTKSGQPIKFEVKKFRLQNARVRVGVAGNAMSLAMPAVEMSDLGTKEGGITADQLALAIMHKVTASVVTATAGAALDISKTGGAGAAEGVKQVGDAIKGLFGGDKKKP